MRIVTITNEEMARTIEQNNAILDTVENMIKNDKETLKMLWSKTSINNLEDFGDTDLIFRKKKIGEKVGKITGRW